MNTYLRRDLSNVAQPGADIDDEPLDLCRCFVRDGQQDLLLAGMAGQPAHCAEQLGPTRDGLQAGLGMKRSVAAPVLSPVRGFD